jgi:hypothetical protein
MAEDKLIVGLSVEIKELQSKLKEAQNKLQGFGNEVQASLQPITLDLLETQLRALNDELKVTAIGSERFKELGNQIVATEKKVTSAFGNISNVGTRGFNGLNNSINQITRELPAFSLSANIGFLAISNNIPILIDEINRLKAANTQLVAQGQPTQSVFKAITGALFSYQTALSIGVTLLTLYGAKLIEFASEAFGAGSSLDTLAIKQKSYNEALESKALVNAVKDVALLSGELQMAKNGLIDKNQVIAKYNESIGQLSGKVTTLNEVEKGLVNGTDAYVRAVIAREAATIMAAKAAETYIKLNEAKSKSDKDYLTTSVMLSGTMIKDVKDNDKLLGEIRKQEAENRLKLAAEAHKKDVDAIQKSYDDQLKVIMGFQNDAGKLLNEPLTNSASRNLPGMDLMSGASDLKKEAETLFNLYKDTPQILSDLGEEYASNPFFRDLINGEIDKQTKKHIEDITKLSDAYKNVKSPESLKIIKDNLELLQQSVNSITLAIGEGMTTAFEQAFTGAESFGKAFEKVLVRLAARLLAALTAAIALATVIGFLSGGTGVIAGIAMPKFGKLLSVFSGGLMGGGDRVVSAVGAGTNQGNVSFEIRGDKLYGVLQNYQSRLDRLQ